MASGASGRWSLVANETGTTIRTRWEWYTEGTYQHDQPRRLGRRRPLSGPIGTRAAGRSARGRATSFLAPVGRGEPLNSSGRSDRWRVHSQRCRGVSPPSRRLNVRRVFSPGKTARDWVDELYRVSYIRRHSTLPYDPSCTIQLISFTADLRAEIQGSSCNVSSVYDAKLPTPLTVPVGVLFEADIP